MRHWILSTLLAIMLATNTGCFLPIYSADPAKRTRQLIFDSENMRSFIEQWERFWLTDSPDHSSPYRVHGGVI
jgi:hypothetical protein